ncbi:MAG: glycoside hydrolase family 9 protein [Candidatus Hydrogenedentes bacterium]|nr:glycoside hydrolase family 9 protein [Candidatus Hydrogenedentota bacterium]
MKFALALLCAVAASSAEPGLKWSYSAQSNLYAPPLVADMHPQPGLETVLSDADVRVLRCVDAKGAQLWEYRGKWTKRLTSGASLSFTAREGHGTLLVGNADGLLCCIDAATGSEVWTRQTGSLAWGNAIWTDLDGDGRDEAVAGTENAIVAMDAAGEPRWSYGPEVSPTLSVNCPIAAADLDGDGCHEVFAVDRLGPLCVNPDGGLRWRTQTGDVYESAPIVTDLEGDGAPELLVTTRQSDAVFCFDAQTGTVLWKCGMLGPTSTYSGSSLAAGDLNEDGVSEVLAADGAGHVHCVEAGRLAWVFTMDKESHGAVSLGDVDGDGAIEVLVAGGDRNLYCLSPEGLLEWKTAATLRLVHPATIADVDQDGMTDILFCGGDRTLRCLTLKGRYDSNLVPWPSRRFDITQSGSDFRRRVARDLLRESVALLRNGGFELAAAIANAEDYPEGSPLRETLSALPRDWTSETLSATLQISSDSPRSGTHALKVTSSGARPVFASVPIPVERGLRAIRAQVYVSIAAAEARVRWLGPSGVLAESVLTAAESEAGAWTRLGIEHAGTPRGAQWLQLVCTTPASGGPVYWDDASIEGEYLRKPQLRVAVNQAGYDTGAPKRFTAWSSFDFAGPATFSLVDPAGQAVFEGELKPEGRITGAYGSDWGYHYWRGDFSSFDVSGQYHIRVTVGALESRSWPFTIGEQVLWNTTARPAYRFFYFQRCGCEVPGFHGACHLDDAASPDGTRQYSLSGGWHDAGDYNTYNNAPYVYGLVCAYALRKEAFDAQDEDANGRSDFLDEILWGGDLARRMIAPDGSSYGDITSGYGFWGPPELETDNIPGTGDERRIRGNETGNDSGNHVAAAAKIARFIPDNAPYLEAAQRAFQWRAAQGRKDALQLSAALDLYAATGNEDYARQAHELIPHAGWEQAQLVEAYDATFQTDHRSQVREALVARAESMLEQAANPFGVYAFGTKDKPNFFGTPEREGGWHVGNSSHILAAASTVATAYRYEPDPRFLEFVYDQLNWILGNNPYDLCLMEGVGSFNPPSYHHRYAAGGVPRGAVPGSVVNGITWRGVGDDRPYFDMRGLDIPDFEPNEVWLPHNTNYLSVMANLHRARERKEP